MRKRFIRAIAILIIATVFIPMITPANAKILEQPKEESEVAEKRVIDVPIIWDDPGYTYPKLFTVTATEVKERLTTMHSDSSKRFTEASLVAKKATCLHFSGRLYHTVAEAIPNFVNYRITFGIGYISESNNGFTEFIDFEVESGEILTPDEYYIPLSDLTLPIDVTYYVFIKNCYPRADSTDLESYVYGEVTVYYTTFDA